MIFGTRRGADKYDIEKEICSNNMQCITHYEYFPYELMLSILRFLRYVNFYYISFNVGLNRKSDACRKYEVTGLRENFIFSPNFLTETYYIPNKIKVGC